MASSHNMQDVSGQHFKHAPAVPTITAYPAADKPIANRNTSGAGSKYSKPAPAGTRYLTVPAPPRKRGH